MTGDDDYCDSAVRILISPSLALRLLDEKPGAASELMRVACEQLDPEFDEEEEG